MAFYDQEAGFRLHDAYDSLFVQICNHSQRKLAVIWRDSQKKQYFLFRGPQLTLAWPSHGERAKC